MGSEISEQGGSFIMFLNDDDFSSELKIPWKAAVGLGKKIHLRASNIRGRAWRVAVETMGENLFFAGGGWKAFSRDVHLKLGEYVVFRRKGRSEFEASVYEITGCERDIRIPVSESETSSEMGRDSFKRKREPISDYSDSLVEISSEEDIIKPSKPPPPLVKKIVTFAKTMDASSITYSRMYIPLGFLNEAGIRSDMSIELRDRKGRLWPVTLSYNSRKLSSGWKSFVDNNGVKIGNRVLFSFKPGGNVWEATVQNSRWRWKKEATTLKKLLK